MVGNIKKGYYPKEYIHNVLKDNLAKDVFGPNKPTILQDSLYGKRFLCKKIDVLGKAVGFATVLEHNQLFQDRDVKLFELLCKVVSCELSKINYMNQSRGLMYEYFITELLDNSQIKKDVIKERLEYIDIKLTENLFVLTAKLRDDSTLNNLHYGYLCNDLESILPQGKCIVYHNSLVMLISRNINTPLDDFSFARFLEFLEKNDLIAGMSRRFSDISTIRENYEQACEAIRIGLHLENGKRFYEYAPYSFYHLLNIVSELKNLKSFCHSKLLEIITYDQKYNTNFTYTLYLYLQCNQNPIATAQELNIHRNTIDYRINKISELFNLSLKDSNVVFSLNYSFKILFYIGELNLAELSKKEYD